MGEAKEVFVAWLGTGFSFAFKFTLVCENFIFSNIPEFDHS